MKTVKWFLAFIIPLYIIDQVTKWWCVLHFHERYVRESDGAVFWLNDDGKTRIEVIPDLLWFPRVHNQGVAWGMGNGSAWAPVVFLIVPIVAFVVISILWRKGFFKLKPARYAAPLLLAGIVGNLTDRLVQGFYLEHIKDLSFLERLGEGYVVDFIAVKIPIINYNFPVFNVADSCVSIAACLLLITAIFEEKLAKRQGIDLGSSKSGKDEENEAGEALEEGNEASEDSVDESAVDDPEPSPTK